MEYHDNDVNIHAANAAVGYAYSGKYTIKDYSITDGQDPNGHIWKGQTHNFYGYSDYFRFSVGRKNSAKVDSAVKDWVRGGAFIFGVNEGPFVKEGEGDTSFNFAFIGTLELNGDTDGLIIDNFVIGQYYNSSNDWIFGSPEGILKARHDLKNMECPAYSANQPGKKYTVEFTADNGHGFHVNRVY